MAQNPTHDLEKPFKEEDVCKAAESFLRRDRFDTERLPLEIDDDSFSESEESDSDTSDDSSDSEEESHKKSHRKHSRSHAHKKRTTKKRVKFESKNSEDTTDSDSDSPPKMFRHRAKKPVDQRSKADKELDDLVEQLSKLSVDDSRYATIYFKAFTRSPAIRAIFPSPRDKDLRDRQQARQPRNYPREQPPHFRGDAPRPPPFRGDGPRGPAGYDIRRCFGCGEGGHHMAQCPPLQDFINKGIIMRDQRGRYVFSNGTYVARMPDETLVSAIKRALAPQSNFIPIFDTASSYPTREVYSARRKSLWEDESEDESDEDDWQGQVYGPDRQLRSTTQARKEKFDGVWMPPKRQFPDKRNKENFPEKPPFQPSSSRQAPQAFNPTPIDVHQPSFNPNDPRSFQEDPSLAKKAKKDAKGKERATQDHDVPMADAEAKKEDKRSPRKSELQGIVNPKVVLDKVLNTPVTMAVGELLAVSKEVSQQVQEVIKVKSTKGPEKAMAQLAETGNFPASLTPISAAVFPAKTKGLLIKLRMECDGMPLMAIIDTGSQLNIVHKKVYQNCITRIRPIDVTRQITMGDANGGEGTLTGFVQNVPLSCGAVLTFANVYVGNNAPFDLLLGQPWQRGNFISIDERLDGTYLQFKDRGLRVNHEILVTPDQVDPEIAEYVQRSQAQAMERQARSNYSHDIYSTSQPSWVEAYSVSLNAGKTRPLQRENAIARIEEVASEPEEPDAMGINTHNDATAANTASQPQKRPSSIEELTQAMQELATEVDATRGGASGAEPHA